jgi:hypothetical protein
MNPMHDFDLDGAIAESEQEARSQPVLHALAAPKGKAPTGAAAAPADLESIRPKLEAASAGGLLSLLGKFLVPLIQKYGPQIVQLIIDLINKKISGTGTTPTAPAPTQ